MMGPCIFPVPRQMRAQKPAAYTPEKVLIGLLHRSQKLKLKPKDPAETSKDTEDHAETSRHTGNPDETSKSTGHLKKKTRKKYEPMEILKKKYLDNFTTERVGKTVIEKMKVTIKDEEDNIRGSYSVKYEEMTSDFFVNLILLDSVFIIEFILKLQENRGTGTSGDMIVDNPNVTALIRGDLLLLENQLPYFIFDRLFGPYLEKLGIHDLDRLVLELFSLHTKIKTSTTYHHITDMFRCVYKESLDQNPKLKDGSAESIKGLKNVENLSLAGVEIKAFNLLSSSKLGGVNRQSSRNQLQLDLLPISMTSGVDDYSLYVAFNDGCLEMSSFRVDDTFDKILRNVIAYEQCQNALTPFTSNYIHFINVLITTKRDVQILSEEGVLTNVTGRPSVALEMVNDLTVGLPFSRDSQYHSIAMDLRAHYNSPLKRWCATLNKVYFSDLWTGTATIVAILILFMTLVGTVASVIQTICSINPPQPYANSIL